MRQATPVPWHRVRLTDPVLGQRRQTMARVGIGYQWEVLNDRVPGVPRSHAVANFRIAAGELQEPFYGMVFQDSDLYKWLGAASYLLATDPDPSLAGHVETAVGLIARAQQPDGYLDTYFQVAQPGQRWTNLRDQHELYCAGHLMEAAVAHHAATGRRDLLQVACRLADHIAQRFGPGPGQRRGYCGHPEVELALVRLYRATGERRYLELARFFVDERGRRPLYFDVEARERGEAPGAAPFDESYYQVHAPLREQAALEGHAVRALYLLSGAIDVAVETDDPALLEVCRRLFDSAVGRRMYVTGGVGSSAWGERFTIDYDLPNDRAYTETCASIALVFAAHRLLQVDRDARYADVMERALYNGVLSGLSLDGTHFFYINPLEVWPEAAEARRDTRHVLWRRQGWFDCACCPPNLARLLGSIGQYVYSTDGAGLYVHLYAAEEAEAELEGRRVRIVQETRYPWEGTVELRVHPDGAAPWTLALRIPGWARQARLEVNGEPVDLRGVTEKGYARLTRRWQDGDRVRLELPIPVERIEAHPRVRADAGRVAIQRGPIVYCLEEVDNGPNLAAVALPREAPLRAEWRPDLLGGVVVITGKGWRTAESGWAELYRPAGAAAREEVTLTFVPYATWANREPGEMLVWVREA